MKDVLFESVRGMDEVLDETGVVTGELRETAIALRNLMERFRLQMTVAPGHKLANDDEVLLDMRELGKKHEKIFALAGCAYKEPEVVDDNSIPEPSSGAEFLVEHRRGKLALEILDKKMNGVINIRLSATDGRHLLTKIEEALSGTGDSFTHMSLSSGDGRFLEIQISRAGNEMACFVFADGFSKEEHGVFNREDLQILARHLEKELAKIEKGIRRVAA